MVGHKICFYGEMWLIIPELSLLLLIWSSGRLEKIHVFLMVTKKSDFYKLVGNKNV